MKTVTGAKAPRAWEGHTQPRDPGDEDDLNPVTLRYFNSTKFYDSGGNSLFWFPESLNVSRDEVDRNIEIEILPSVMIFPSVRNPLGNIITSVTLSTRTSDAEGGGDWIRNCVCVSLW